MRNQNFVSVLWEISLSVWMKFNLLPQLVGLLKLTLNLVCTSNTQWTDYIKYTINFVLCCDTWELTCFKLSMMLDMTKLYNLIPVCVILMFTEGHRVTWKLKLVQSFCCKVAWSNSNVHDSWLCKGDDCEEVLCGEYRSFEHLLLLFYVKIVIKTISAVPAIALNNINCKWKDECGRYFSLICLLVYSFIHSLTNSHNHSHSFTESDIH